MEHPTILVPRGRKQADGSGNDNRGKQPFQHERSSGIMPDDNACSAQQSQYITRLALVVRARPSHPAH
jgi:hypothetical protein